MSEIKPVAFVGSQFSIGWAGRGPLTYLIEPNGIKVGQGLYAQSAIERLTA